jgi:hypothetical protein
MDTSILWQRGQDYPDDLPSGEYQFTYRVPKYANLPGEVDAAAAKMCNQLMVDESDGSTIIFNSYTTNFPLWDIYGYVTFDAIVQGIGPAAAIILILALLVAVGIVGIFVEKNLYQITRSPAGQLALGSVSLAILVVVVGAAYLMFKGGGHIGNPFKGA